MASEHAAVVLARGRAARSLPEEHTQRHTHTHTHARTHAYVRPSRRQVEAMASEQSAYVDLASARCAALWDALDDPIPPLPWSALAAANASSSWSRSPSSDAAAAAAAAARRRSAADRDDDDDDGDGDGDDGDGASSSSFGGALEGGGAEEEVDATTALALVGLKQLPIVVKALNPYVTRHLYCRPPRSHSSSTAAARDRRAARATSCTPRPRRSSVEGRRHAFAI